MKELSFFAVPEDIRPALRIFETTFPMKFVEMGKSYTPDRAIYLESEEIPEAGLASHETASRSKTFLVSRREIKNAVQADTMDDGRKRWDLFPADNPEAVVLTIAGIWRDDVLLPGTMFAMYDNETTKALISAFRTAIRKEGFSKVSDWWVGRNALAMLKAGMRLATVAEKSPPSMDLKLPDSEA